MTGGKWLNGLGAFQFGAFNMIAGPAPVDTDRALLVTA
jgi:hypothetical protein